MRPCPEESRDWDTTQNLYIEGDNLDVLKLLQESYLGKVKMIYIDPPYNTGSDFIYRDDFSLDSDEYNEEIGVYDEEKNRMLKNTDSNGRFHSDWCSMIYSRLLLARNLLTDDGIIFISIDDHEVDNLSKIASEVFGSNNFLACFPRVTKKAGKTTEAIAKNHDYVLCFCKNGAPLFFLPSHTDDGFKYSDEYVNERGKYKLNQTLDYDSLQYSSNLDYPIEYDGEIIYPGGSYEKYLERKKGKHARADWAWRWSRELFDFGLANGFIVVKKYEDYSRIYTKTYQHCRIEKSGDAFDIVYMNRTRAVSTLEFLENEYSNDNSKKNLLQLFKTSIFDYSKPTSLLKTLTMFATNKNDIILDFFSGSATMAQAVFQANTKDKSNRSFIMVQLPEVCDEKSEAAKAGYSNICEIGKERIRRAGDKIKAENPETKKLDIGFRVLKVDSTNMNDVYYGASEVSQDLIKSAESNVKDDRTDLDLLFGCLLDWGLPLSLPYKSEEIDGVAIHDYNSGDLIACFAENVPQKAFEKVVETIAKRKPIRAVFRDSCFETDAAKINVTEIFKRYSPDTRIKTI
ncbi:MAG: site-specific DNA-methyltransferase [Thermoguttaceae bacterium]|nr:site-specific DNA-methyltransferase [Thermoguttaceae bacterium]